MSSHGHGHGHGSGHEQPKVNEFEPKLLLKKPEFFEFLADTFFANSDPTQNEQLLQNAEFLEKAAKLFEKKVTISSHLKKVLKEKVVGGLGLDEKNAEVNEILSNRTKDIETYLKNLFRTAVETGNETQITLLLSDVQKHSNTAEKLKTEREKFETLKNAHEDVLKNKASLKKSNTGIRSQIESAKHHLHDARPIPLTPKELLSFPVKLKNAFSYIASSLKSYGNTWKENFAIRPVKSTFALTIEPFKVPFKLIGFGLSSAGYLFKEWSHASEALKQAKKQLKTNKTEQRKTNYFGKKIEQEFLHGQETFEALRPDAEREHEDAQEKIIDYIEATSEILEEAKIKLSSELLNLLRNPETSPEEMQKNGLSRLTKIKKRQADSLQRIGSFDSFELDGNIIGIEDLVELFTIAVVDKTSTALQTKLTSESGTIINKELIQKSLSSVEQQDFKNVAKLILNKLKQNPNLTTAQRLSAINTLAEIESI